MFGLSFSHLLLLSVIALVVIGPKQLPEVARVLGRFINDLKRTGGEITKSFGEMRDNQNQTILQHQKNAESAPIVSHEPSASTTTLGDQLGGEPRSFNATGASPLADRAVPKAVDDHQQMSFDITNEKPGHGS